MEVGELVFGGCHSEYTHRQHASLCHDHSYSVPRPFLPPWPRPLGTSVRTHRPERTRVVPALPARLLGAKFAAHRQHAGSSRTAYAGGCLRDDSASSNQLEVLRASFTDEYGACRWVEEYALRTNTSWNVDFSKSAARCERMLFHKIWRCKQYARGKATCGNKCAARIDIKVKKTNKGTKKNDTFLRGSNPLPAVIKICHQEGHTHSTESAEAHRRQLRCLTRSEPFSIILNAACLRLKP